ncbi:M23 family metallopeptidase [Vallitalea pronyensis]|uniref:M23 family metallopeptidase n=1 Tax=Vallitalea pronyensis TaxID=1348613 RepID=A0A8J8SJ20_9FIRM|nr:M23 family metallopeptidase [Vallitalea pronyensis]QUI25108.1 M23 family metallopeptidase [Vallitalea pronyensis]
MKKAMIILLLSLIITTHVTYAENASVLLSLYGFDKAVSVETEEQRLLDITEAYTTVQTKVKTGEMMEKAIDIYIANHHDNLAVYDDQISTLEHSLKEQRKLIYNSSEKSVEYLLELDAQYQTTYNTLKKVQANRNIYANQLDILTTNPEHTARMKQEYKKLEHLLATQEKNYKKATSYPELGDIKNLSYPLGKESYITSGFGEREDPFNPPEIQFHRGIDLSADMNTDVTALFHGTVETVGSSENIGYYVIINHGKGIKTLYGHLDHYHVEEGQKVKQHDIIASSGNSGKRSTGPHLHLGLYINGIAVNPIHIF